MAGDGSSYLEEYAAYFKTAQKVVATLCNDEKLLPLYLKYPQEELLGECLEWTQRYLRLTKCPQSLLPFLTRSALDKVDFKSEENSQDGALIPNMVQIVNEVLAQYYGEDNPALHLLPPPPAIPYPKVSTCAIKNSRRRMEDRHAIVDDLHTVFGIPSPSLTNYYGLFDGHSGVSAATYCANHMHCFIAQSPNYPTDPEKALYDAFATTESLFTEKCNQEEISSGCTVLCVLHRPVDKSLHVAWVGDSQAIVVSRCKIQCLVNPHRPNRQDEQERIVKAGGDVIFFGTWRVNGQLAVSRAIGDVKYKQFVPGIPEVTSLNLSGDEDFLVLGCDGLWDYVKELEVAAAVYEQLQNDPNDLDGLSQSVVSRARDASAHDNITVVVVLLKPTSDILAGHDPAQAQRQVVAAYRRPGTHMDILDAVDNANNPFLPTTNGLRDDGGLLGALDNSRSERHASNDRRDDLEDEDDEDDLGPETDVDAVDDVDDVDDVLVSPTAPAASLITNPFAEKTTLDTHEVLALALGGDDDDDQPASLEAMEHLSPLETLDEGLEPPSSAQDAKGEAEVAEAESESEEDEWNYFKHKPEEANNLESGSLEDMESQLNPNAAVFVPSTPEHGNYLEQPFNENLTQEEFFNKSDLMSSSFIAHGPVAGSEDVSEKVLNGKDDEIWLSSSPKKGGVPLDNVHIPPEDEFDREVSQRPSDLDVENNMSIGSGNANLIDDLLTSSESRKLAQCREDGVSIILEPAAPTQIAPDLIEESSATVTFDLESVHSGDKGLSQPSEEPYHQSPDVFICPPPIDPSNCPRFEDIAISPPEDTDKSSHRDPVDCPPYENYVECPSAEDRCLGVTGSSEVVVPAGPALDEKPEDVHSAEAVVKGNVFFCPSVEVSCYSPVVSGYDHTTSNSDLQEQPSFGAGLTSMNYSTGPLDEGFLCSNSGFGNLSNVLSQHSDRESPAQDKVCAQSTPFEAPADIFKFDSDNEVKEKLASEPVLLQESKPIGQQDSEPAVQHESGPVAQQELEPVVQQEFEPIIEQEFEPVVQQEFEPVVQQELEPVVQQELEPVVQQEFEPAVQQESEPAFQQEFEPAVQQEFEPAVQQEFEPAVQQEFEPAVQQEFEPAVEQAFEPVVEQAFEPVVEQAFEPVVEQAFEPVVEQAFEPVVEQAFEPVVEQAFEPVVEQAFEPVVEQAFDPVVQHECEPVVQQQYNGFSHQVEAEVHSHFDQDVLNSNADKMDLNEGFMEVADPVACVLEKGIYDQNVVSVTDKISDSSQPCFEPVDSAAAENIGTALVPEQLISSSVNVDNNAEHNAVIQVDLLRDACVQERAFASENNNFLGETADTGTSEDLSDVTPRAADIASSGAIAASAVLGAAAVVAATSVAASKTDKKSTSKASVLKPKSSPLAKGPAKVPPKLTQGGPATSSLAPKKPAAPIPAARSAPKSKPVEPPSKPTTTRPAAPKPRTTAAAPKSSVTEKKSLSNGDAAKAPATKPARPPTRPVTAPSRTTTRPAAASSTVTSPAPAVRAAGQTAIKKPPAPAAPLAAPKPKATEPKVKLDTKPNSVGVNARPRSATALAASSAKPASARVPPSSKPVDKQTKETTNKMISATRATMSRPTASKSAVSKTTSSTAGQSTVSKAAPSKPAPIRKPASSAGSKVAVGKKPMTNGVVKNGHATPDEIPVQNGVSHHEPVIHERESDLKVESLVDNQVVV